MYDINGVVYKLYCEGNPRFYIGSCQDLDKRWKTHVYNCKRGPRYTNEPLYQWMREVGILNIKKEILKEDVFFNRRELNEEEKSYIQQYFDDPDILNVVWTSKHNKTFRHSE